MNVMRMLVLMGTLLVMACGGGKSTGQSSTVIGLKSKKVEPENLWNGERLWKRVGENPPTYHPREFDGTSGAGVWITDRRDGKRFFIPEGGVNGIPESVLHAEALKATGARKAKKRRKD